MLVYLLSIIFAFPLFFFPWLPSSVFGAKQFFLILSLLILFVIGAVKLLGQKKLKYKTAFLDLWPILFLVANIVSWFTLPRGTKVSSLLRPLGLGSVLVLVLWYLAWGQTKLKEHKEKVFQALSLSVLLISVVSVVLFVLPDSMANNSIVVNLRRLGLANSLLRFELLLLVGVLVVSEIVRELRKKETLTRWWLGVAAIFVLVGLGVNSYQLIQNQPRFLDWFSSWATAVETFKRQPLRGIGPGNYTVAFNSYRPREFNQTDFWTVTFGSAHSWFLQVWTELGLLGLVSVVLLVYFSIKVARQQDDKRLVWFLSAIWIMLAFFPGNLVLLFLLFLTLALVRDKVKDRSFTLSVGEKDQNVAPMLVSVLLLAFVIASGYFFYKGVRADYIFFKAVQAVSENRGGEAYQLQSQAIQTNRFMSNYRSSFAQTNLAIANNIIQQAQQEEQQLTEEQRRQVSQLINQAVNEAKAAVALEPRRASNWQNLAQIYRQLVNLAENAEQWTLSSFQQAIALDSLNPRIRVSYGGFLFGLGQYEEAARQFEIAANLKPDYANSWYNWAHALKEQDKLEPAVARLQQAVNLIDQDSQNYDQVQEELSQWKEELGEEVEQQAPEQQEGEELTRPEPLPTRQLEEPIELSDEAAPPIEEGQEEAETEPEITPTVTPELTPTPTISE
jgi:Tfp pilus assembly protein PilF